MQKLWKLGKGSFQMTQKQTLCYHTFNTGDQIGDVVVKQNKNCDRKPSFCIYHINVMSYK